jgi:asparagine synthase (glutamine-hydrolysing)
MCGFCGYVDYRSHVSLDAQILKMVQTIKHRGPDDEGIYINNNVALGHTRLAIIDLSKLASQPMVSNDGDYVIIYNGELYNFLEIKLELEAEGAKFRSKSDTEVVLNAWRQWGEKCVEKFNGLFAFTVYDKKKKRVFLVRDRYGIKPLYYGFFDGTLIFGSEIKSFFTHSKFRTELSKEALVEYLTFQNLISEQSLFMGLKLVEPGTILEISTEEPKVVRSHQYWDFKFQEQGDKHDFNEYKEEFYWLMERAVNRQLLSDVEIGSYLSGGMDSSTIASIAAKKIPNMKTFTVGFDMSSASGLELGFDERAAASFLASELKTDHFDVTLKSGDMESSLTSLVFALDEPRVGQSYPNFFAAKLASEHVKVVLSGVGGDELFAGYPWRYFYESGPMNFDAFSKAYYTKAQRLIPNSDLRRLLRPIGNETRDVWTLETFRNIFRKAGIDRGGFKGPHDYVNASLYFEAKTFLHGLLIVEDKLSMAYGLETRVPFLDNDLVDFAMRCPVEFKIRDLMDTGLLDENDLVAKNSAKARSSTGKYILRESMQDRLPRQITSAMKQGFSGPDGSWFKGESLEFVERILGKKDSLIYEYLDRPTVLEYIREHSSGIQNRRLLLWSLLNLETWLKTFG